MEVVNKDTHNSIVSVNTDNVTLSNTINTILSIVKETMKKTNQIDRLVRYLCKPKDKLPSAGVV